jgi:hypothetical protein
MGFTLPQLQTMLDTKFTETWYEIKSDAQDNIMNATPIWAYLMDAGCLKEQRGGTNYEETIEFAFQAAEDVNPGHVFSGGSPELKTAAFWPVKMIGQNIQRSLDDDRANSGQFKIKSYIDNKMTSAKKGLTTKFENVCLAAETTSEAYVSWASLNDLVPAVANNTTGTYGKIARPTAYNYEDIVNGSDLAATTGVKVPSAGNTWWGAKYLLGDNPPELNYEQNLTTLWNSIQNNQTNPDFILTTKKQLEIYENFCQDKSQLVINSGSRLAQLGFTTFKFKGSDLTWSPQMPAKRTKILTTSVIKLMYDPGMWFDMTPWKPVPNMLDSFAQILCAGNMYSNEPRRHGELYYV